MPGSHNDRNDLDLTLLSSPQLQSAYMRPGLAEARPPLLEFVHSVPLRRHAHLRLLQIALLRSSVVRCQTDDAFRPCGFAPLRRFAPHLGREPCDPLPAGVRRVLALVGRATEVALPAVAAPRRDTLRRIPLVRSRRRITAAAYPHVVCTVLRPDPLTGAHTAIETRRPLLRGVAPSDRIPKDPTFQRAG